MPATNFRPEMVEKINSVLEFVLKNPYSDFYRKKYKNQGIGKIASYEDFQKIPVLTKDEILAAPWEERTFIPAEEIKSFSFSSGTTNNNKPTIIPRGEHMAHSSKNEISEEYILETGTRRILILNSPVSFGFINHFRARRKKLIAVPGDIRNLPLTAKIAQETKIQAISSTPTILDFFVDELKKLDFDFSQIKWIYLGGEFCSEQRAEAYKNIFPEAKFSFRFRTSEIGGPRGWRCQFLDDHAAPSKFHLAETALEEAVDEKDRVVETDQPGNLLHTDIISGKAFPLIRYKTNDSGFILEENCLCGEKHSLLLGGRIGHDVLRLHGVILNTTAIETAISKACPQSDLRYEMHVSEEKIGDKFKPKLKLSMKIRPEYAEKSADPRFIEMVSEKISSRLYLSAKSTLRDLVEKGIFLPLEVEFSDSWPQTGAKSKRIISHLH